MPTATGRRIAYLPLDELQPASRNPKRHDEAAIGASIDRFGYVEPMVLDERTGRLVAGHGRLDTLLAAQQRGGVPPDGVKAGRGGRWSVPVLRGWSSVDDAHAESYLAASNRLVELGGWDDSELAAMLADLREQDADLLQAAGFSPQDLAALLSAGDRPRLTDPDDAPPLDDTPPICETGDLWLLGEHRLVVGSATNPACHARVLDGRKVELLLTDPPYGVSYVGAGGKKIVNDDLRGDQVRALVRDGLAPAAAALQPGAGFYVFSPSADQQLYFRLALEDAGLPVRQECVWVKNALVLGRSDWQLRHESVLAGGEVWEREFDAVLYGWQPDAPHRWEGGRRLTSVWEFDKPTASKDHPTMKPVVMLERVIAASCPPGGVVLDPFAGSGSTLIAAYGTGRVAACIELDQRYADVICRRFEQHTGVIPVRDGQSVSFMASVNA